MTPPALFAYRAATRLAAPFAEPLLLVRARRGKEDVERLGERLGRPSRERPAGKLIWLHGASVGEGLSILPLVEAVRRRRSDVGFLVTTGTLAAASILTSRLPQGALHQFAPIDAPGPAARFARAWRPDIGVFVESDLWPNLILEARRAGARLALLSARLSPASIAGWSRVPRSAQRLLGRFELVMAQSDAGAAALVRLGARDDGRLNLKRFTQAPPVDRRALEALTQSLGGRPLLLAASTHPGEEEIAAAALKSLTDGGEDPLLVVVPRHPARAGDIQELLRRHGIEAARRSLGESPGGGVYIADTLGEMGLWFSLARAALIGGSLRRGPGGHNPLEAALLGCPILTGPHVQNWEDVYGDLFRSGGARAVHDAAELASAFDQALADPAALRRQAQAAHELIGRESETLERAADRLVRLLG